MSRYDLSLSCSVSQNGAPFLSSETTWHNLDDDGLAAMIGYAKAAEAEVVKQTKKGGDLSVTLTDKVTALDGGAIPDGANGPATTHDGVNLHGLVKIEDAMTDIAREIVKMGREHANRKGPKK